MSLRTNRFLTPILALLIGGAFGASSSGSDDDEIIPPEAIYKIDPTHPPSLYKRGIEGEAVIIASIDRFGSVVDPMVDRATHDEFGLAAMLAASEWIFEPATQNGVPISLKVKIPFQFTISYEHKLNVELGRPVFQKIDVPIIPSFELEQAPLPTFVPAFAQFYPKEFKNTGKAASVSVEFVIDPEGYVVNPRIISISTPGFEMAAIRAVSHMRYKTIRVDGHPVYASISMPIQFSP